MGSRDPALSLPISYYSEHSHHPWANQNILYPQVQPPYSPALDIIPNLPDQVPIHAPVPGYPPLLSHSESAPNVHYLPSVSANGCPSPTQPASEPAPAGSHLSTQFPHHQDILDFYAKASEQKFPTPSELLSQLTGAAPQHTANNNTEPEKKFESQRKARQRAVAESIGFEPTDPDTISSHDKKRHYLECLEAYVVFLHEQLALVGAEPLPLERVSSYRGLSSRSIRTLLVHMENTVRTLHQQSVHEEQVFLKLRDQVMAQEAAYYSGSQEQNPTSSRGDASRLKYIPQ